MNATLTADRVLPVTGAGVTALAHGRGIVLRDPSGDLLDVLFAMPEYGPCLAGAWRRAESRRAESRRAESRRAESQWALAAGQAPADDPVEVSFLRRRRTTQFHSAAPARVHRLGELWVAEAVGDFTAAMVRTPAGVRARRLEE
jgi:hypothetical protein